MLGRTISHYRITAQLGAGGMGVVYAGEDIRLGRAVALKFVPEELGDPRALERLRAEARATSALNHASICTVYDIGEYEGRPYIVMELLKGQTLRDCLSSGPLKIHQTVDIAIQVADALDAAHAGGILHRDIKPANLFLVDRGPVKILDFGLAKHVAGHGAGHPSDTMVPTTAPDSLTAEGLTVGTVSYMSPEQVTGEQLDGRTDLFSLGIVLYECVTGRRPFTGKASALVLSAILNESPVAPVILNPQIPPHLQDVINNCLEKDRELRYQDAAGLRADLKRVRRDLESGHSSAVKAVSAISHSRGRADRRGSRLNSGIVGDAPRFLRVKGVVWGAALAVLSLAGLTSYWFWLRGPTPQRASPAAEVSSSDTAQRSRVTMATSSLQSGNYRDALGYAQDVLRLFPDNAEARRVRDEAAAAIARFDEAIARGRGLLGSGDLDGASAALNAARGIDPSSPAVGALSEQIVAQYKTQALARQRADQSRGAAAPSSRRPSSEVRPPDREPPPPSRPVASPPLPTPVAVAPTPSVAAPIEPGPQKPSSPPEQARERPPAAPPPVAPPPTASPPTVSPPTAPPPTASPPAAPPPATAPPAAPAASSSATPSPSPRPPEPAPPRAAAPSRDSPADAGAPLTVENDEAMIRRVVDGWARAIENKDLSAYRALKPNMTAAEQRRIEEGFRAVSAQRVAITIIGIEKRAQESLVRLRRRDTIQVDGRQQTQESQQTMTVVRSGSGWVIRDIGR